MARDVGAEAIKIPCGFEPFPKRRSHKERPQTLDAVTPKAHLARMNNKQSRGTLPRGLASMSDVVRAYAGSLAMVALSTLLGLWIAPRWGTASVDMIYLPAVLGAAALWGLWPGVIAGVTSALAYNFFFTAPVHTLRIDRVADIVTVTVLLIVALVTGRLAAGIRRQARIADAHAARNAVIAGFARRLLSCSTEEEIARVTCEELRRLFDCNAVVVSGLPTPQVVAMAPDGNRLTPSDLAAAVLAIDRAEPAEPAGFSPPNGCSIRSIRERLRLQRPGSPAMTARLPSGRTTSSC